MKKSILILCGLAFFMAVACQKENPETESQSSVYPDFTCELAPDVKASIGTDGYMTWAAGDEITIFTNTWNHDYRAKTAGTNVVFEPVEDPSSSSVTVSPLIESGKNYGVYPTSVFSSLEHPFQLPAVQNYYADGNIKDYPMIARSENNQLAFKNICGILNLKLKSTAAVTVKSIEVQASVPLAGEFTPNFSDYSIAMGASATHSVKLDCGEGVAINSSAYKSFMIALPPISSPDWLSIVVRTTDNKISVLTMTNATGFSIERSKSKSLEQTLTFYSVDNTYQSKSANCYVINTGSYYSIPVADRVNAFWVDGEGKGAAQASNRKIGADDEWVVEAIWQDIENGGKAIATVDGRLFKGNTPIRVKAKAYGNIVLGIKRLGETKYSWSIHIWATDNGGVFDASNNKMTSGVYMSDRNIGSQNSLGSAPDACGMYYQWGRKDPFPLPKSDGYCESNYYVNNGSGTFVKKDALDVDSMSNPGACDAVEKPNYIFSKWSPDHTDWSASLYNPAPMVVVNMTPTQTIVPASEKTFASSNQSAVQYSSTEQLYFFKEASTGGIRHPQSYFMTANGVRTTGSGTFYWYNQKDSKDNAQYYKSNLAAFVPAFFDQYWTRQWFIDNPLYIDYFITVGTISPSFLFPVRPVRQP